METLRVYRGRIPEDHSKHLLILKEFWPNALAGSEVDVCPVVERLSFAVIF
jgi:hypothetical protein